WCRRVLNKFLRFHPMNMQSQMLPRYGVPKHENVTITGVSLKIRRCCVAIGSLIWVIPKIEKFPSSNGEACPSIVWKAEYLIKDDLQGQLSSGSAAPNLIDRSTGSLFYARE